MVPHVISHKIFKRKQNTPCESQCTMIKLNYEILLTSKSLNNYVDYCLTTLSYIIPKLIMDFILGIIYPEPFSIYHD
jgi:hypothetical protein